MNPAPGYWSGLADRLLPGVNPTWFAPLAADLVASATGSARGRSWLWSRLIAQPRLTDLFQPRSGIPESRRERTLMHDAVFDGLLLELGALAHAGDIRTQVDRRIVLGLRGELGEALYERAVRFRPGREVVPPESESMRFRDQTGDARQAGLLLRQRGANELGAWMLRDDDRAGADLLALRCPRDWCDPGWHGVLPEGVVASRFDAADRLTTEAGT